MAGELLGINLSKKKSGIKSFGSIAGVIQCAQGTIFLTLRLKDSDTQISLKVMSLLIKFFS